MPLTRCRLPRRHADYCARYAAMPMPPAHTLDALIFLLITPPLIFYVVYYALAFYIRLHYYTERQYSRFMR